MTIDTNRADVFTIRKIKAAQAALADKLEDASKRNVGLHDALLQLHHLRCCGIDTVVSELRVKINDLSKQLKVAL
jgi:hypothetical protein